MTIARPRTQDRPLLEIPHREIDAFLSSILREIEALSICKKGVGDECMSPEGVFGLLTKREYSYLSKKKASRYRANILGLLEEPMAAATALPFFYDIGGGYHASICPGDEDLVYRASLAELLIIYQVAKFTKDVQYSYAPGVRFSLVVDNLCAALVNDISVEHTLVYCSSLREMIEELGLSDNIELLVESENYSLQDYQVALQNRSEDQTAPVLEPTAQDIENVSRFLGRRCSKEEAAHRMQRYRDVIEVSESFLDRIIDGVHMTQRATANTFGFRPFPGGDSRVQAGEVVLSRNSKGNIHPVLLTSRSASKYNYERISAPDSLPATIRHITYAENIEH